MKLAIRKSSKKHEDPPQQNLTVLDSHPFLPGQHVEVYEEHKVTQERQEGSAPRGEPIGEFQVKAGGNLSVANLEPGRYVAVAEVANAQPATRVGGGLNEDTGTPDKSPRYVAFTVLDPNVRSALTLDRSTVRSDQHPLSRRARRHG